MWGISDVKLRFAALAILLTSLGGPTVARAADSIYWTDEISGEIRVANLDGTGTPKTLYGASVLPTGLALDPANGKLYWFSKSGGAWGLREGSLDGSESPRTLFSPVSPEGLATDPGTGKLYLADGGKIEMANLDGTGAIQTLYDGSVTEPVGYPWGLAVDDTTRNVFWTDQGSVGAVRVASLDGRSPSDQAIFPNQAYAYGIAIDPVTAKAYWSLSPTSPGVSGTIMVGNDWGGTAQALFPSPEGHQIFGIALDPRPGQQKIYWASGSESVRVGNLDGTGTPHDLFSDGGSPTFVAILVHPEAAIAPAISGGNRIGQRLSCTSGTWAPDILGAFLYRAPQSLAYQWLLGAVAVPGARSSTFTPATPGQYSCRVTGTNVAGSTSQTSAARSVLAPAFGSQTLVALGVPVTRIRPRTAVKVVVLNSNAFAVTGRLTASSSRATLPAKELSVAASSRATVLIALPRRLRRLLTRKHRLKLLLSAAVKDPAGDIRTVTKTVTLRLKRGQ
jgi:DNA-binding beta-propeller fold protein YncE